MILGDEIKQKLIALAAQARHWAYCPYSKYPVGAALVTASGRFYDGVNIENAAFPLTICAERVAVFKAVAEGEKQIEAIAVVTEDGGTPCGSCRQVLAEFSPQAIVLIADAEGNLLVETSVSELLPSAFTAVSLNKL